VEIENVINRDKWRVVERECDSGVTFLRYRYELSANNDYGEYSKAFHVFWDFDKNEQGIPVDTSVLSRMELFENDIINALETDLSGVLVAVLTMNGYRQWLFCIKSEDAFFERLNSIPVNDEPHPLEIERERNNGWDYFFENIYTE